MLYKYVPKQRAGVNKKNGYLESNSTKKVQGPRDISLHF